MIALQISANGQIAIGNGRILRAVVLTPAAAVSTLILYDNTAASGTILAQLQAAASGASAVLSDLNVRCSVGIYAAITGAGATAVVYYE